MQQRANASIWQHRREYWIETPRLRENVRENCSYSTNREEI
jgi:hypothetical protein